MTEKNIKGRDIPLVREIRNADARMIDRKLFMPKGRKFHCKKKERKWLQLAGDKALWSRKTKNRDISTQRLAHLFAHSLAPLTYSLAALTHSLAALTHLLAPLALLACSASFTHS